jgi:hypothetical protein
MKILFATIVGLAAFNAQAQTSEAIVEERSSAWIKVVDDPIPPSRPSTAPKKQTATVKKKSSTGKPAAPKQDTQQEFEKTNNQVNRFKKQKKG